MPGLTSPQNFPYPLYSETVNVPSSLQSLATAVDTSLTTVQANLLAALSRKAARATSFTNQSTPNTTTTTLTFTLEDYDTDNIFNIGTSNTNFVIQTAGTYRMIGTVRFSTNATGDRQAIIFRNGSAITFGLNTRAVSGVQTQVTANEIFKLAAGDIITLRSVQTSGGALNVESAKLAVTRMSS